MRSTWLTAAFAATVCSGSKLSFLPSGLSDEDIRKRSYVPDLKPLEEALEALGVMQEEYFQPWVGEWPSAIDWTAAVMGSHVSGLLTTLSQSLGLVELEEHEDYMVKENLLDDYFSQLVGFYFGQNALSVRHQAYDDMLWIVLGWLDTTQFVDIRTASYRLKESANADLAGGIPSILRNQTWHGNTWVPALAHRARIFWELASKGWDYVLCGGGMTWNPRLEPYKNAITNELYISASINMYLYFPGDANSYPYTSRSDSNYLHDQGESRTTDWKPHDPRYLHAAISGYEWLIASGMTNSQGLFTDGFHISGYRNKSDPNTKCDVRNEMVYTYNQGVVLTGQLGLFKATGSPLYLVDGHILIQNVIAATGYDLTKDQPIDDLSNLQPGRLPRWHGLGRAGVLEDLCDRRGDCSQNGHTFKGIFFHHLTTFCASMKPIIDLSARAMSEREFAEIKGGHERACAAYLGWVRRNADAALLTRDSKGRFGTWWTAGLLNLTSSIRDVESDKDTPSNDDAVDYRNYGIPDDPLWEAGGDPALSSPEMHHPPKDHRVPDQAVLGSPIRHERPDGSSSRGIKGKGKNGPAAVSDPNDRGRGRTVETQGGGVAVLRALWEISRLNPVS